MSNERNRSFRDRDGDGDYDLADRVQNVATGAKSVLASVGDVRTVVTSLERGELDGIGPRAMFGFSIKQIVPSDEIHVVVGDGFHIMRMDETSKVFGRQQPNGAIYRRNPRTEITRLVTTTFEVPIKGVGVYDKNNVAYFIDAFCQAGLDTSKAEIAAEQVGGSMGSFISALVQITESSIVDAAAKITLDDVISNRTALAEAANDAVGKHLENLGYKLVVLTVRNIYGPAVDLKAKQAEAELSRDTTIKTNAARLATSENQAQTDIRDAEIKAGQRKATAEQQRTTDLQLAEGAQTTALRQVALEQEKASVQHAAALQQVELKQAADLKKATADAAVATQEAENSAAIAALRAQQQAELTRQNQERQAALNLQQAQSSAQVAELTQARELELAAAKELAETERYNTSATARANTASTVAQIEATAQATALTTKAKAEADAATQRAAGAQAEASAKIKLADATRAEAAAAGLAQAEVQERMAQVALVEADATKAKGLAEAEVTAAQLKVQTDNEAAKAALYQTNSVLLDLELKRLQVQTSIRLAEIQSQMHIQMITAIAPQLAVKVFGNGGNVGSLLSQLMMLNANVQVAGEEIPMIGNLLGMNGEASRSNILANLPAALGSAMTAIDPSIFSNLSVADIVEQIARVQKGDATAMQALNELRKDGNFKLIANIPIGDLIGGLMAPTAQSDQAEAEAA